MRRAIEFSAIISALAGICFGLSGRGHPASSDEPGYVPPGAKVVRSGGVTVISCPDGRTVIVIEPEAPAIPSDVPTLTPGVPLPPIDLDAIPDGPLLKKARRPRSS